MAIKLYGHAGAVCTKRVIITCAELNLPFELVKVDLLKGDQKQPGYLTKHPFGKIPYLEDGEGQEAVCIAESRAICRYLVTKYAGSHAPLMPNNADLRALAQFEQAASFEESYFDVHAKGAALGTISLGELLWHCYTAHNGAREYADAIGLPRSLHGRTPDQDLINKHIEQLDAILKVYDGILAKQNYVAGDDFTVVDIFHGPVGWLVQQGAGAEESFRKYPNVQRWWRTITGRESFKILDVPFV